MKNKLITILLTICMLIVYMPVVTFATNVSDIEEEQIEDQDMSNSIEEETEEILSQMEDLSDANIDFSSKRLIVKGLKKELNDEPVIASLDGVYLLQYDTYDDAIDAYYRLSEISDSVEFDSSMNIASGSLGIADVGGDDVSPMTEEENPFVEAEDVKVDKTHYNIAVIDTGAVDADKIISVLGDDGKDNHGHGQLMINAIKDHAPDAKILSIKAIGDDGVGDVSAVYAAIKLAIDEKVDIINLSISALASEDNFIIEEIIAEARSQGITVVGAAGNNGIDAKLTIPGKIDDAIIVGMTNDSTNTGDTVDYYLPVNSTSVAAAIVSGLLASDTLKDYEVVDKVLKIDFDDDDSTDPQDPSEDFKPQGGGGGDESGGSASGGSHQNYKTGHTYVWFDRGGWKQTGQAPVQGYYQGTTKSGGKYTDGRWHNGLSGQNCMDYFLGLLTNKINSKDSGSFHYAYDVIDDHPKWQAGVTHKAYKRACEEACLNALNRSIYADEEFSRVVGAAVTYCHETKFSANGDTYKNIWYINTWHNKKHHRKFDYMFGGGESGVRMPNDSEVFAPHPTNGNNLWSSPVDPNRYTGTSGNQTWKQYVYYAAKSDVDQSYADWKIYIVAASDSWPDDEPCRLQITKNFATATSNATVCSAVVAGNPLYTVQNIKFNLYKEDGSLETTLTIGANGKSEIVELQAGDTYRLVELPSTGGVIIPDRLTAASGGYEITLEPGQTLTLTDAPATGSYRASYRYVMEGGGDVPSAVEATLPTDSATYVDGAVVRAKQPSSTSVEVGLNTYVFQGWDISTKTVRGGNVTFTGTWSIELPDVEDEDGGMVLYDFVITDWTEEDLPSVFTDNIPVDEDEHFDQIIHDAGETVVPKEPELTLLEYNGYYYHWDGWDKPSAVIPENGNVTFIGTWHKGEAVPDNGN